MSHFPKYPEIQRLMEWLAVWPGDSATPNRADEEAIRARNHACTPTEVWHFAPEFSGINNGETGV